MATEKLPKPAKWFSSKGLSLSYQHLRSKSSSSRRLDYVPSSRLTSPDSPTSPKIVNNNAVISRQEELRQVFGYFDGDGDGKISAIELRAYFGSIGEYMSYEDALCVIKELDTDGDGLLDFHDFLRLMKRGADQEDLKKAFEMFELEKGDGCITPRGLQRMLSRLGDPKSLDECATMIQVFDTDGDGVIDFHEFHEMMT
ncbi:probable calcium-binding protein CML41 [Manihot esculenta]|uniref:EF-hand domain-containing protein n=1 Tax=Manihot esculenta TaxID=3983 RepID=A0A2C9USP2_MANES|nr:probable calcium-binding protein CML41 [Manihot esculenta]OAY33912.1 hypothetical protein MANES_13G135200v8 [Manihot esculenta]